MTNTGDYLEIAREVMRKRIEAGEGHGPGKGLEGKPQPLEAVLSGSAIELWSTPAGRLLLVADEDDARFAMHRFGAARGEIYTAPEVRRIITVGDPQVVAEIHAWKRRFDGILGERRGPAGT